MMKSPCPLTPSPKNKRSWRKKLWPSFIAIGVFILGMIVLFIYEKSSINGMMLFICGIYALTCLLFLLFQMYAFIRAHIEYDEDVERIKYRVFEAEGMEYVEEEMV